MQVNFFYEIQVRDEIYLTWKIESNLRNCNFYDFEILANIVEIWCTWKKPDIQYLRNKARVIVFVEE